MNTTTSPNSLQPTLIAAWSVTTPAYVRYSNRGNYRDTPRSGWERRAVAAHARANESRKDTNMKATKKLSQVQREILDQLVAGSVICRNLYTDNCWVLVDDKFTAAADKRAVMALRSAGLVSDGDIINHCGKYYVTKITDAGREALSR